MTHYLLSFSLNFNLKFININNFQINAISKLEAKWIINIYLPNNVKILEIIILKQSTEILELNESKLK